MINPNLLVDTDNLYRTFTTSDPFPFIVMDNFLNPWLADLIVQEVKRFDDYEYEGRYEEHEWTEHQFKKQYMPSPLRGQVERTLAVMQKEMPLTLHTLYYLNSNKILDWLEKITGINNLLGDNEFLGGGVHKVANKGFLDVHTDFTAHFWKPMSRRLNLLIYLNKDWQEEYNGNLELWDPELTECKVQVRPIFNRAILFRTTGASYHGHPIPLNLPDNVYRFSLALYYYTETSSEVEDKRVDFHSLSNATNKKDAPLI